MNRKRRVLDKELKKKVPPQSNEKCNTNEVEEKFGTDMALLYRWRKEFKSSEFDGFSGDNTLTVSDLKRENISLQKLLSGAKMEHNQLKKAISVLSVSDRNFTWS